MNKDPKLYCPTSGTIFEYHSGLPPNDEILLERNRHHLMQEFASVALQQAKRWPTWTIRYKVQEGREILRRQRGEDSKRQHELTLRTARTHYQRQVNSVKIETQQPSLSDVVQASSNIILKDLFKEPVQAALKKCRIHEQTVVSDLEQAALKKCPIHGQTVVPDLEIVVDDTGNDDVSV